MSKKIITIFLIFIILWAVLSIPLKIFTAPIKDKYKVVVQLNNGKQVTGYTTRQNYIDYYDRKDLVLLTKTFKYEDIEYVVQMYNRFGNKETNYFPYRWCRIKYIINLNSVYFFNKKTVYILM